MIAFEKDQAHFNYRVAGVAIHNGHILLDRSSRNNYWVLPGGHPELMESMAVALRREINEEIGAEVKIIRLLWVMENFFHKKRDIHELSFYFLMELDPDSHLLKSDGPFQGQEKDNLLTFQWFSLDETILANLPLYPGFLATALLHVPETPQHIVFDNLNLSKEERIVKQVTKTSIQRLTIQ
jgi:ADP-ribose pyrophosphatase YjhB (NUDIX family)